MKKNIITVVVAVVLSVFGSALLLSPSAPTLGGLVQTNPLTVANTVTADSFVTSGSLTAGSFSATTATVTGELKAKLIVDGMVLAKSASTGWTATAANICNSTLVTVNNSGASASTSYFRFPTAAALVADCLPDQGDQLTFVLRNVSNDAGENTTLTANTSVTLKVASASGGVVVGLNEGAIVHLVNTTGSAFDAVIDEYGN